MNDTFETLGEQICAEWNRRVCQKQDPEAIREVWLRQRADGEWERQREDGEWELI